MKKMSLDEYRNIIKDSRNLNFKQPYEFVYDIFLDLGYDEKNKKYFRENASSVIEELCENCWNAFVPIEKAFTTKNVM